MLESIINEKKRFDRELNLRPSYVWVDALPMSSQWQHHVWDLKSITVSVSQSFILVASSSFSKGSYIPGFPARML